LRTYVGSGPGAPLDLAIKLLAELQQQLAAAAAAGTGPAAPAMAGQGDAGPLLLAEAARAPPPVRGWLTLIAGGSSTARAGEARKAAQDAFNGSGGPARLCHAAVERRFPFARSAAAETPLDDFTRLFAPGGQLDAFFTQQIRPFVDMGGRIWQLQPVNGVPAPIGAGDLAQFQRAAAIRDQFFPPAGGGPSVRFEITPTYLDAGARQVTLTLGDQELSYAHGPLIPHPVLWPGPQGMGSVRLSFDPPPANGTGVLAADGPWALFRLLDQGTLTPGASTEQFELRFTAGEREVRFLLRAGSVLNPFTPGILQDFRCPLP
jgi:type VI secretion system protein ImpL